MKADVNPDNATTPEDSGNSEAANLSDHISGSGGDISSPIQQANIEKSDYQDADNKLQELRLPNRSYTVRVVIIIFL